MAVQSYRQLVVWQKAMELVKQIYELTKGFPKEEIFAVPKILRLHGTRT